MDISKAGDVIERMKWAALKKYFTSKGRGVRQCIRILLCTGTMVGLLGTCLQMELILILLVR